METHKRVIIYQVKCQPEWAKSCGHEQLKATKNYFSSTLHVPGDPCRGLCSLSSSTGMGLKEAPSPTSATGNVANCPKNPKPPTPAPGAVHDMLVLFHFPPASCMAKFVFSEGQGSTVLSHTQDMEVGSIWWKALMPTTDRVMDRYREEKYSVARKWSGG